MHLTLLIDLIKKFELSLMVFGGICSKGLSNLIILERPENEFSYAHILPYSKDNYNKFSKKRAIFEQEGGPLFILVWQIKLL